MAAFKELVDDVYTLLSGFGLHQPRTAWLGTTVDDTATVWAVDASSSLSSGVAEIEDEVVYIRLFDANTGTLTVAPDGRGWDSTTAAAHNAGVRLTIEPTFPRGKIKRAINATIGRTFPHIWALKTATFSFTPAVAAYALPADAESIVAITAQTYGPSGIWAPINDYSFDGHADVTTFPTGKTVTITGGTIASRTIQVTYIARPTLLTNDMTDFVDTGLSVSAREAVVYGTCSSLMRFIDPIRLTTNSAQSDELDSKKVIGRATEIANGFEAQFQNELVQEAARLRMQYPTRTHRRRF